MSILSKLYRSRPVRWTALSVASVGLLVSFDGPAETYFQIAKNIEIYTSIYSELNRYYVEEINPTDLMSTGLDAMLESLDPYTTYIPEEDIEDYRFISTGEYGGIGAVIGERDNQVMILMPYENWPAHKGGLQIGDVLLEVDGVSAVGLNTTEVSRLLKGQAGTEVKIKVSRYGVAEPILLTLGRERIKVSNVPYYGMIERNGHKVGYVQLRDFTSDASLEVRNAYAELRKQGAEAFILDLRGNPGGLLDEAIKISNLFVDKGKVIVSTKGKVDKWNSEYFARESPFDTQTPLVVLVNDRSASASEIVSGVIQDYDRGVLIGQRTYGKGLVQATIPVAHNGQLKVTTAKYYIPSGRCIQAIDYSIRDEKGEAPHIPDSLLVAFRTLGGRQVFDGAGITPDIESKGLVRSELARALVIDGWVFKYATKYRADHASLAPAQEFTLTSKEYEDFVAWLKKEKFNYASRLEKSLESFESQLGEADMPAERLAEDLADIRAKIDAKMWEDLSEDKAVIIELLEEEIAARYYLMRGQIEASFDEDPQLGAALDALADPARYKALLRP